MNLFGAAEGDVWLVFRDPLWNLVEPARKLPAGTDLLEVFLNELLRFHHQGWEVHGFSSDTSAFNVTKEGRRGWRVALIREDPSLRYVSRGVGLAR